MTVHLIKMAVGVDSIGHLERLQAARLKRAEEAGEAPLLRHFTRNCPRRAEELCAGGSLYWVIRGLVSARQRVVACERHQGEDGGPLCALVLEPRFARVEPRAWRPFQGWRYLTPEQAPPDVTTGEEGVDLPAEMADALRSLGLL